jgi:DNA-binding SARP family transcriptional activator
MINFRVLGPIEVTAEGQALPLGDRKQRLILALLLLNANQMVPVERLISEVWGTDTPEHPLNTVQVYISNLRNALRSGDPADQDQLLIAQKPGYRIQVTAEQLDMLQFLTTADRGTRLLDENRYEAAASCLRDALALWRGTALADLVDEPFAQGELAALEEYRLTAIEARVQADLALGRTEQIIGELDRLITDHPYHRRLRGLLMLTLYLVGQQAEVLQIYHIVRSTLLNEIDAGLGPGLREVERAILAQVELTNIDRRTRPYVLFHDAGGQQHILDLDTTRSPLTIGRRSSNDLSLVWDQEVSRVHAHIEHTVTGWELVDEGRSRNGSYVNGERMAGRRVLHDADVIRLGATILLYRARTCPATTLRHDKCASTDDPYCGQD